MTMSLTKNLLLAALAAAATIGVAAPGMASAQSAYITYSATTYSGGYRHDHDRDRDRRHDQDAYGYDNGWNNGWDDEDDNRWTDNRGDDRFDDNRWDNDRWHHRHHHRDGGWDRGYDRDARYRDYCRHHPDYRGGRDRWDRDNGGW